MSLGKAAVFVTVSVLALGLVASPRWSATAGSTQASLADPYVYREHSTAHHERVDMPDWRIDKVEDQHNIGFSALVRAIEWARSPRMATSADGDDRGIYRYKLYEYLSRNGRLERTGRWCIIQTIIEWGDGHARRGGLITAWAVADDRHPYGGMPTRSRKSWAPEWVHDTWAFGPPNNEILY